MEKGDSMKQHFLQRKEIIQIILSVSLMIIAAVEMLGEPARLVSMITITAGAIGTGVGIGVFVERKRLSAESENGVMKTGE
jgi:hypothetical protein